MHCADGFTLQYKGDTMLNVYITDLAAYNKGYLYGEWVNLPLDQEDLNKIINKILRGGEAICAIEYGMERHEEYFITDWYWDDLSFFSVDEYDNPHMLNTKVQILEDCNRESLKAIAFLMDQGIALDLEDAICKADDVIIYNNYSMEDVAYDLIQECYGLKDLPALIANNIDYDGIARDLEYEGIYWEIDGDIYEYCG